MNIKVHDILARRPFRLMEGRLAPSLDLAPRGEIAAEALLAEPGWTLHGLDYDAGEAVFLDVGKTDLFRTPFCYKAQAREATRYAALPFPAFIELSRKIRPRHRFIQFFNIGHCGSTLVHHVINASGQAWDVSEPRFCFDLAWNRDRLPLAQQAELAKAGLAFLSLYPLAGERGTIVVKHFSQGTKSYGIWHAALADARCLYMYRDAFGWCNSVYGFAQRLGMAVPLPREMRSFVWNILSCNEPESYLDGLVDLTADDVHFEDIAACAWSLHAKDHMFARQTGMAFHPFRYNELMQDRAGVLAQVFDHCALDRAAIASALSAFDQDAHEGEISSHDIPVVKLGEEARARILAILKRPSVNLDPELQLGT